MAFLAEAETTTTASPEAVFDRLVDFASWHDWMPPTFRPLARETATLHAGARIKTKIARLPGPQVLEVTVCDRPREVTWRGGVPGLVRAEHRFLLEPLENGGTRIRSVETWRGPLALAMKPIIKRVAERIGRQQIDAIAKAAAG